jgi:hypothetical protein
MNKQLFSLLFISVTFLFAAHSWAFTYNNNIGLRFKNNRVKVSVASNTTCPNGATTKDELLSLIDPAIEDFWNKVPTSRLVLVNGGEYQTSASGFYTDVLCLVGASCTGTPIPLAQDIVIACNNNSTNFASTSLLALAMPNGASGRNITSAIVLINDIANSTFKNLSRQKKISVIAHEIGHAIGLGHSDDSAALMYFQVVPKRDSLGQDDVDGVTSLYPNEGDLFGQGCFLNTTGQDRGLGENENQPMLGTQKNHNPHHFLSFIMSLLVGFIGFFFFSMKPVFYTKNGS